MELRWDPVLGRWVIVADHRGIRPLAEKKGCPFCPGSEEVPDSNWDVLILKNKFAALKPDPPPVASFCTVPFKCKPAVGDCEVVLFHPRHDLTLADMPAQHIRKIIEVWAQRTTELGSSDFVKYVYIFENKGKEVGTSLEHPHCQIYALPFVPPVVAREIRVSKRHYVRTGKCLFCDVLEAEERSGKRIVNKNEFFTAFLPFAPSWPYGVVIYPRRHLRALPSLSEEEVGSLATSLKDILLRFDNLFNFKFPYVMVIHQSPCKGNYPYYHLHLEFYPPYRERDKLKFFAGIELGGGTPTYDYKPEDKAMELRSARGYEREVGTEI